MASAHPGGDSPALRAVRTLRDAASQPRMMIAQPFGPQGERPESDPARAFGANKPHPTAGWIPPTALAALINGLRRWIRLRALKIIDEIAERRMIDRTRTLDSSRHVSDHLLEQLPVPVWVEDESGRLVHHNRAFRALFRREAEALIGRSVAELLPETSDSIPVETRLDTGERRLDVIIGRCRLTLPASSPDFRSIAPVGGRIGTITDITERKEIERRLRELATTDDLTGALSRRAFFAAVEQEAERSSRYGSKMSLMMIDLDHFKQVNDRFGHAAGDRALKLAAQAMVEGLRDIDALGRMGGEEFAVLLPQTSLSGAIEVAERLRKSVAAIAIPVDPHPMTVQLTVSIGVAERLDDESDFDRVLSRADAALYRAKDEGRDRVVFDQPRHRDIFPA
ncbi:GGDEF domain-containing protein [Magnetospirillum fulvum]|nr:diguanylate cyclase [Magnetospirillum fulvum]